MGYPAREYIDFSMSEIRTTEHRLLVGLIRAYRIDKGLRQVDLADALGMPQSMISKLEVGERRLDVLELRKICTVLEISISDFILRFEKELGHLNEAD